MTSLAQLGVDPVPQRANARFALVQTARRLWQTGHRVVGLLPATPAVATMGLALQLAKALSDLNAGTVAVIDANPQKPALAKLAPEPSASTGAAFVELRLQDSPIVVTTRPRGLESPTGTLEELARVVAAQREQAVLTLLDLTGFRELGEHLDAYQLADGVVIVAHTGKTPERAVARCSREIPAAVNLGVLLIERS